MNWQCTIFRFISSQICIAVYAVMILVKLAISVLSIAHFAARSSPTADCMHQEIAVVQGGLSNQGSKLLRAILGTLLVASSIIIIKILEINSSLSIDFLCHINIMLFLCLMIYLAQAYLDANKIKFAVDSGNPYYYKDRQKVLFRYDQNFESGHMNDVTLKYKPEQSHHLLPLQYLDINIFLNERVAADHDSFKYAVNLKLPGNYTLILCFVETEQRSTEKRLFDIFFEITPVREAVDIVREAGGLSIPVYYPIEFEYKDKTIFLRNTSIIDIPDNKLSFDVIFRGKGAKLSGLILYSGTVENIIDDLESALLSKDQIEATFITPSDFVRALKQKALRYAQRSGGRQETLINEYLSPFQHILKVFEQQDKQIWETLAPGETSTFELFIESILHFVLIPLGNVLYLTIEFVISNKILVSLFVANFWFCYYCLVGPTSNQGLQQINLFVSPTNQAAGQGDNYLSQNTPKSRQPSQQQGKLKKKKK